MLPSSLTTGTTGAVPVRVLHGLDDLLAFQTSQLVADVVAIGVRHWSCLEETRLGVVAHHDVSFGTGVGSKFVAEEVVILVE